MDTQQERNFPRRYVVGLTYIILCLLWLVISDRYLGNFPRNVWWMTGIRVLFFAILGTPLYLFMRKERDFRESRFEYTQLVNMTEQPVLIHTGGTIVEANWFAARLIGAKSPEDLIGRDIIDMTHPDDRPMATVRVQQILQGIPSNLAEVRLIALDGSIRHTELLGVPIHFRGQRAVELFMRDVTQQRRMEAELHQTLSQFRMIEENMTDAISVVDPAGNFHYHSPSHRTLFGGGDFVRFGRFDPGCIHPEDRLRVERNFTSDPAFRTEFRVGDDGTGDWVTVELICNPILTAEGNLQNRVIVARDITERKRTEELLRQTDKLSMAGRMAAGIAHELRNPMTSIKGFLHLLAPLTEEPNAKRYIDIIESEIRRIEKIATELLALARPQPAQYDCKVVGPILEDVVSLFAPEASHHQVTVSCDIPQQPVMVYCDENQLKQVFVNMIKNAIESMNGGGFLHIGVAVEAKDMVLRFQDTGTGLASDELEKLGTPFYSTKSSGTGLGVMVSHKIIVQHGGQLRYESQLGVGTTVTVTLPVA